MENFKRHPQYLFGRAVTRQKLMKGINLVYYGVRNTLSPKGSNSLIMIPGYSSPLITNDGATISKYITSADTLTNAGCELVREVALKSNEIAGDGTTTSIILAKHLMEVCFGYLDSNPNREMYLSSELRKMKTLVKEWIATSNIVKQIKTLDDIKMIATVSSNDERIGNLVKKAYELVGGTEGLVTLATSEDMEHHVVLKKGYKWESGHLRQELVTNPKRMETVMEDSEGVYVLLYKGAINVYPQNMIGILKHIVNLGKKLLIIAEDFNGTGYAPMFATRTEKGISVVGVKSPGFGERTYSLLQDIEAISGATIMDDLSKVTLEDLGKIGKVEIGLASTTITSLDTYSTRVDYRIEVLKEELAKAKHDYDKTTLSSRIAMLSTGVSEIQIGAVTETELKDRKLRGEDALCAVKVAIESGYTAGGGLPYLHFYNFIKEKISPEIASYLEDVYLSPLVLILRNCGENSSRINAIIDTIKEDPSYGYNALTGKLENLYESGVLDPIKVVEQAIINSLSIAEIGITASSMIIGGNNV